nr:envelope protein UL20 [Psittacid alphaherpesvirus 6]
MQTDDASVTLLPYELASPNSDDRNRGSTSVLHEMHKRDMIAGNDGREDVSIRMSDRSRPFPIEMPCTNGTAELGDNNDFCEDIESAIDYVTASSYGGDYDFYGSSGTVIPGGQPIFTRRIIAFFLTTILIRPLCCTVFFAYGRLTSDYRLFDVCLAITLLFYAVLAVETFLMYANISADRMPLGKCERLLVGSLEVSLPIIFVSVCSCIIFRDVAFFGRVLETPRNENFADSIDAMTASAIMIYLLYSVLSIFDALVFVMPRLWVIAVTKTSIPF